MLIGVDANHDFLIKDSDSHHHYMLKPSDISKLRKSDLIFYVSRKEDAFMTRFNNSVELIDYLTTLPQRNNENNNDTHVWLSTKNVRKMIDLISSLLSEKDPDNQNQYLENSYYMKKKLDELDTEINFILREIQYKDFIYLVDHDSYRYFEDQFSINSPLITSQTMSNSRFLSDFIATNISCRIVSSDLHINPNTRQKTLVAKTVLADSVGFGIEPNKELYFSMMKRIAYAFVECVGK